MVLEKYKGGRLDVYAAGEVEGREVGHLWCWRSRREGGTLDVYGAGGWKSNEINNPEFCMLNSRQLKILNLQDLRVMKDTISHLTAFICQYLKQTLTTLL